MKQNQRGVTLVELMVVVAIVGILATIGSIAYGRYMAAGKMQQLEQIALQIGAGQDQYRSRNNQYYPSTNNTTVPYLTNELIYQNLLGFNQNVVTDIIIETTSWDGTGAACAICGASVTPDLTISGYAVRVTRDLNAGEPDDSTVIVTSQSANPTRLFEGK